MEKEILNKLHAIHNDINHGYNSPSPDFSLEKNGIIKLEKLLKKSSKNEKSLK